ncbi:MAG: hypothetical protein LBC44_00795 [Mycoplasmataceae bacterium]|nr:hypothetical protein [Mycoplasmataceae bacterium]
MSRQTPPDNSKEYRIGRKTNTQSGILKDLGDEISLYIESEKPISWEYGTPIFGINYDETVENTLTITLTDTASTAHETKINVTASDGEKTTSEVIIVGKAVFCPILFTSEYFKLETTTNPYDTVLGFSDKVNDNPELLNEAGINALDFSVQNTVKFISKNCHFDKTVFEVWKVLKLDFEGITFLNDENSYSASHLFYDCNLNSVIELDLKKSNWATSGTVSSAYETFSKAELSGLAHLDFNEAIFACENMSTSGTSLIHIANHTFTETVLSGLNTLDLSNAVFAVSGMNSATEEGKSEICTAYYTFYKSDLSSLITLELAGAVFSAENMLTSENTSDESLIVTAENTFNEADLSSLVKLDLSDTVFASSRMITNGIINTAYSTFEKTVLSNIESVVFENTLFSEKNMLSNGIVRTANGTFIGTDLSNLESIDLAGAIFVSANMVESGEISTAYWTFTDSNLKGLTTLELKDVVFATDSMMAEGIIYTAIYTFYNTNLSGLETLDLTDVVLVSDNMAQNGTIYTACETFFMANLSNVTDFNISSVNFVLENITKYGEVHTAYQTFIYAKLSSISVLDLSNTSFCYANTTGAIVIAENTFLGAKFGSSFNTIFLPFYKGEKGKWLNTFTNQNKSGFTIYGYVERPSWFDTEWWNSAEWFETA